MVLRLNLTGLEDLIIIISAREESLAILDQLRVEVGDDPNDWLPLFLARVKQGYKNEKIITDLHSCIA